MENHPIPQDITGFQFRLIGDMTIKQFAYVAAGAILGWLSFSILPHILLKIPVAGFFAVSGFAAAFFPVAGRPLDIMITNYIKALFTPAQYVYQKTGIKIWFPESHQLHQTTQSSLSAAPHADNEKLKAYLATLSPKLKNKYDERELTFFQMLSSFSGQTENNRSSFQSFLSQVQPKVISAIPTKSEEDKKIIPSYQAEPHQLSGNQRPEKEELSSQKIMILQKKLQEAKLQETVERGTAGYEAAHKKVLELEKLLNEVQSQKLALENQIQELQKKLEMQGRNIMTPGVATPPPQSQTIKKIPISMGKSKGAPILPDIPNLVSGVIKDPRGNPLPNILVEIKDERGNPVRAFKSNIAGQFASATPLVNGVYTLYFEDPKNLNKFDEIEINVTGEVMLPLEIFSVDQREELRRSLFETKN